MVEKLKLFIANFFIHPLYTSTLSMTATATSVIHALHEWTEPNTIGVYPFLPHDIVRSITELVLIHEREVWQKKRIAEIFGLGFNNRCILHADSVERFKNAVQHHQVHHQNWERLTRRHYPAFWNSSWSERDWGLAALCKGTSDRQDVVLSPLGHLAVCTCGCCRCPPPRGRRNTAEITIVVERKLSDIKSRRVLCGSGVVASAL